jgi:putative flavoprotein involved in K+ transport
MSRDEYFDTIVIGGGQAGLATGYYLSQLGKSYLILDENPKLGTPWRKRWDSLRLFTPNHSNHLPGMKFPGESSYFPTKDEAAAYLEAYAGRYQLPIQQAAKVTKLARNESGYQISTGDTSYHANHVVIATGAFHTPFIPPIAQQLSADIFQLHSVDYHNPGNVQGKNILVVGAGNSGAEIATELSKAGRNVWLAGRDVGRIPADKFGKILGGKPYWWFMRHVMTINTPLGRRMKSNVLTHGNPLIRARREEIGASGVEFTPRLAGVVSGKPQLDGGRILAADCVIWATGFKPDYQWIELLIFDSMGRPLHNRGVVGAAPGLFFVGLHFQTGLTSSLMGGVGEDARYITSQI